MKKLLSIFLSVMIMISAVPFLGEKISKASATEVQQKTADIYFIAGQSNASGCSDFYRNDHTTLNLSGEYLDKANTYINGFDNVLYYGLADSREVKMSKVKVGQGISQYEIGPELGMAEYLNDKYTTDNKKAVIIKYALGASSIIGTPGNNNGNWLAPSFAKATGRRVTGRDLYAKFVGTSAYDYSDGWIYNAIIALKQQGFTQFNFKSLLWAQGEAELVDYDVAILHGPALTAFIDDFRRDLNEVAITAKTNNYDCNFSNASNLNFLISEVCPTFNNGYVDGQCLYEVIGAQQMLGIEKENVDSMSTADFVIAKNTDGMNSTAPGASYCADPYHYNPNNMIELGNRAGNIMYEYAVENNVEVDKPTGVWFKINDVIAKRTVEGDISRFNSRFNNKITLSYSNAISMTGDFVVDYTLVKGFLLDKFGYEEGGVFCTSEHITENNGKIIVKSQFLQEKLSSSDVIYLSVITKVDPSKTPEIINEAEGIIKIEFIDAPADMKYFPGDDVKFKIYLTSYDYLGLYNLTLCKGKNWSLTPDENGVFTFRVSSKDTNCNIEINAKLKTESSVMFTNYELEVDPSIPEPMPEPEPEPNPDEELPDNPTDTPNNGGEGSDIVPTMGCAMMTSGDVLAIFVVATLLFAIVIAKKSRRLTK